MQELAPLKLILDPKSEGQRFRSALSGPKISSLRYAKFSFLLSQYLPMLLYYLGTSEQKLKFPASLSYTTSRGLPRLSCLALWLLGWSFFLGTLDWASDLAIMAFASQMLLTAGISAWSNQPNQGRREDVIHMAAATLYILDHVWLMELLGMRWIYQAGFYSFFLITAASLHWGQSIKRRSGVPAKHTSSALEWQKLLAKLPESQSRQLWWAELSFMVAENLVFTSFVLGLTSGSDEAFL